MRRRLYLWTLIGGVALGAAVALVAGDSLETRARDPHPLAEGREDDPPSPLGPASPLGPPSPLGPLGPLSWQQQRQLLAARLRADGYTTWSRDSPPRRPSSRCGRLLFAGHVYPKNGLENPGKTRYPDRHHAMASLLEAERRLAPDRVVFGGDTIQAPSRAGTNFIAKLAGDLPHARFVLGNHERWWSKDAARLREILGQRHGVEDLGRVRLVRLHSIRSTGSYGLDEEERRFLRGALNGEGYDWAIVMLHHALWAGDTAWVNRDYPNAERLREDWLANVLPQLQAGRVRAVLTGDAGWRKRGVRMTLAGIPHFTSGWSGRLVEILPEWLVVDLCEDGPIVTRHVAFDGEFLQRLEWPPEPPG